LVVDVDNGGQNVAQGLAGSCLGNTHEVRATHGDGPALSLDGGGRLVALSADLLHDVVGQIDLREVLDGILRLSAHCDLLFVAIPLDLVGGTSGHAGVLLVEVLLEGSQVGEIDRAHGEILASATSSTAIASESATAAASETISASAVIAALLDATVPYAMVVATAASATEAIAATAASSTTVIAAAIASATATSTVTKVAIVWCPGKRKLN